MADFNEIMMRVGIDANGVVTGMGTVRAMVKSQFSGLANDLRGFAGRWLGILGLEQALSAVQNRIIAVGNLMQTTGLNSNMVQGIMNKVNASGDDPHSVFNPLSALSGRTPDLKQFLGDLADSYVKLNTQEERNAMLQGLQIKNWQSLIPLLQDGRKGIEDLDRGNFFTKLSPAAISLGSEFRKQMVAGGGMATSVLGNTLANITAFMRRAEGLAAFLPGAVLKALNTSPTNNPYKIGPAISGELAYIRQNELKEQQAALAQRENKVQEDGFTLAEKRVDAESKINEAMEERKRLQDQIIDRDKFTVDELAQRARELLGTSKMPRGLKSVYSVSDAMKSAVQIQDLEDKARIAAAMGFVGPTQFQSQADRLRASNPALKSTERYPIEKTQQQIEHLDHNIQQMSAILQRAFPRLFPQ